MATKIILTLILCVSGLYAFAQPANDLCANAQVINIPASGNICLNSSNAGATSDLTTNACDTGAPGNEIWFTFITTGGSNSVTITPNGATPASSVVVSMQNTPCGSGTLSTCNSATGGGAATATFSYTIGTQVWVSVETNGTDGSFQICVNSVSQPPAPGNSCGTATRICNKNTFSVPTFPLNVAIITPGCFPSPFQQPIFYQFTVGTSGTCIWNCDPNGAAEYDWVMYDITAGCPGTEVCCNFNYASASGAPVGMATGGAGACGTTGFAGAPGELSPPANVIAGRTYLIVIDNYSNSSVGFTWTWGGTFEMAPVPNFTATPTSGCAPLNVTFTNTSVATTTYDWDFGNGNTSTSATPPAQTYTTPGSYLVNLVATSASGCTNVKVTTITVNPNPTVNPQSNQTHCPTATVPITTFTSPQAGTTFSWSNSNTAIGLGASGTGNLPSFTATNTGSTAISATITVTPTLSGCSGTPITFTITINPRPTVTAITPIVQCAGTSVPSTVFSSTPAGATFGWTNNNTAIGLGASGSGNQPTFTATNAGTSNIVSTITVTPTLNGCTGPTSTYTITIKPIPTVTVPAAASYCPGASVPAGTFTTSPVGGTTAWSNSNTAIGLGASGAGNQPTFTAAANATGATVSGTISVTPTVNGCSGTPVNYTISIFPTPTVVANPDVSVCTGDNVSATSFTSSPAGATFTWSNSNTSIGLGANGTGSQPSFVGTNATGSAISGNIVVTPSLNGCIGTTDTYVITISPVPTMTVPTNITQCGGAVSPAAFVSNPVGATFTWTNTNTAIGLAGSGNGNISTFTGTNGGAAPISGTVSVTPSIGTCVGTPVNFTITINPTPIISAITDVTACENANVPQTTISVVPATSTTSWSNSNTAIGLGASGNGNVPAFTATNASSSAISGTVTINASANGCNATPVDFLVTITELPDVNPITDISQCHNTQISPISFSSSSSNVTYSWTNNTTSIGLGASGNGNIPGFTASNPSTTAQSGTVTVTPAIGTCIGTPETFTITVNPTPVPTAQNNGPLCPGDQLDLTATGLPGSSYSWSGPGSYSSSAQNPSVAAVSAADAGTYTVTVTLAGCSGTASTTLAMNPGVAPIITQAGPFCLNDNAVLLNVNSPGGTWSGTGISNPASGQFSPSIAGAGTHTITYTLNAPCAVPATSNIIVNPLPTVNFNAPVKNGCVPFTVNLTDLSTPASNNLVWDFGDGTNSTQTGTVSHTYNSVGCFDVTLTTTSAAGCTNTLTIPNFVCANPFAVADASVGDPTHTVIDPSFQFFNNSSNATSYTWNFGDGTGSTETNPSHSYPGTPGSYTVMLAANNQFGCPDTTYLTVVIEDELIFYVPNTFTPDGDEHNNMFTPVFYSGFDPQSFTMLIFDRWGEIIFETHDVDQGWHGTYLDGVVKEGVYTWTMQFKVSESDKKVTYTGHVTLLK